MAKKLLLINPSSEDRLNAASVGIFFTFPPPSLAYLAALTPSDWDIQIVDENVEPLTSEDSDLVGITAMTSNAHRAYQISAQYRQRGIKTVMGGIHASMLYDEAIQFADSVVIGEAESVWQSLIHDFKNNELKRFYRGERTSLENLVRPRNDLYSDRYRLKASVQTARGCPMDCEFCSVTAFNGRTYRQRPVEEVLDELEALNCKEFFFSDDNILNYGKKAEQRAIQLFQGMVERRLNKRWVSQVGIDFGNNTEILNCAKKAGCLAVHIGFESISEESLEGMGKARNLRLGVRKYREVIKRIHDHGIGVHGAFILGSDGDRKDVFQSTIEFILDSHIDSASFTILTPLPGTKLYERLRSEGRLLRTNYPDDWKRYDFAEAVFRPMHMTPDELEEGVYQVYKHTTSRVTSLKRAFNSFIQTRNLPVTAIAYSLNRGLGSFATRKYQCVKNARSSGVKDPYPSHPVADGESSKAGVTGGSPELTTRQRRRDRRSMT
ncbi:MAG: B12-binding domain-containing radical SAM protein [Dehalococcoidia bacterium]|nr:B12-binding domain-containing radical SAM protein [Dehalococcoidia bacterium]